MTPADVTCAIFELQQAIAASVDKSVKIEMDVRLAELFLDFLHTMDPDMPSMPICKALGPLVGDVVMNRKLARLDDLADKIGPAVLLLSGMITQLDRGARPR